MTILDRYVAREILKTFVLAIAIFTVVFLLATLYELLRQGYNPQLLLGVLFYAFAYTTPYLVPVALAIACALAYGRLTADNEYIPILTGGVHPGAVLWPGLLLGLLTSILMYGCQSTVVPYCYFKKSIRLKIIEDLVALPKTENLALGDRRKGFFLFARRTDGDRLEGVEMAVFPGALESLSDRGGRIEMTAARGRIRRSPDLRVDVELEDARLTYFALARREEGAEAGDVTEGRNTSFSQLRVGWTRFEITSESKTRFRMKFRTNQELAAYRDDLARWIEWAEEERGPAALRADLAVAAALAAAPGAGLAAPLHLASLAATAPGAPQMTQARKLHRHANAILHERLALSCAPFLFALISVTTPLLLRSNNRLLPFFVAFCVVGVTFFVPHMLAISLVDKGRAVPPGFWPDHLVPWTAFVHWPGVALTLLVGGVLLWRLARR